MTTPLFDWKDANVLVTGGAGFLGTHLVNALLDRGARVTIFDSKPTLPAIKGHYEAAKRAAYVCADIADEHAVDELVRKERFHAVFHLAAEPIVEVFHKDPARGLQTNVRGTWVLLDALRRLAPEAIVVMASSDKAYGTHETLPYDESAALQGRNPYDCSKSCADLIGHMFAHTYGLRIIVTRCGNIYGEGDLHFSRLIPDVIRHTIAGKPFVLRSNGKFLRDFLHVSDAVSAYLACADALRQGHAGGEAYNFAHNAPQTVLEVVEKVLALMDAPEQQLIVENSVKYEIRDQYLDSAKARERLQWIPSVRFEDGLKRTIEWYRMLIQDYPEYAPS